MCLDSMSQNLIKIDYLGEKNNPKKLNVYQGMDCMEFWIIFFLLDKIVPLSRERWTFLQLMKKSTITL